MEWVQSYLGTLQTCRKCGLCFQNRHHVYRGQVPLCRRCRTQNRFPAVVVQCETVDQTVTPPIVFRDEYVIPAELLPLEMFTSLAALDGTTITTRRVPHPELGLYLPHTTYADTHGIAFHETFPREEYRTAYDPFHHHMIQRYQYRREFVPP